MTDSSDARHRRFERLVGELEGKDVAGDVRSKLSDSSIREDFHEQGNDTPVRSLTTPIG